MRDLGPLDLELQNIVRRHMGSENRNWVLCKRSKHSLDTHPIPRLMTSEACIFNVFEKVIFSL